MSHDPTRGRGRALGALEDDVRVVEAELLKRVGVEVDVRGHEAQLADLREPVEHRRAGVVGRLLQAQAVDARVRRPAPGTQEGVQDAGVGFAVAAAGARRERPERLRRIAI